MICSLLKALNTRRFIKFFPGLILLFSVGVFAGDVEQEHVSDYFNVRRFGAAGILVHDVEALTAPILKVFSGFTIFRLFLFDYCFITLNRDKLTIFW